jgi:autophagy-related protein 9
MFFKSRFFSFITGSFAAVLLIATILSPDLLHDFEITPGFSSFFYITVFGAIAALLNGMIPAETEVYDPEKIGKELVDETHYFPEEWRDKLHTSTVLFLNFILGAGAIRSSIPK